MNTPVPARPGRVAAAGAAIIGAAIVVGAVLAVITRTITGRANPLPSDAPWRWSIEDITDWFSDDATSAEAVDVAVRILAVLAWMALAVIVVILLRELAHQARHGVVTPRPDPMLTAPTGSPRGDRPHPRVRRRHGFAATIVGVLLGGSTLVAAAAAPALPGRAPATAVVEDVSPAVELAPTVVAASHDAQLPTGWQWGTYTVATAQESLVSIARQLGDDPSLARTIWDANQGRDMSHGERWTDPAVVKLGWTLRVPALARPTAPPAPPAPAVVEEQPAATSIGYLPPEVITVANGDNLWQLSENRLARVGIHDDGATAAYLAEVIAANPDVIEDPNLIYVGEQFQFPAVGTPPAAPAEPVAAAPATPDNVTGTTTSDGSLAEPPAAVVDTPAAVESAPVDATAVEPPVTEPATADVDVAAAPVVEAPVISTPTATIPVTAASAPPAATDPLADSAAPAPPAPLAVPGPAPTMAVPAVQPGDSAATPPTTTTTDSTADSGPFNPFLPLAAAGMTIGGLLIGLDRRRRRRQARQRAGLTVALPEGQLAADEHVVRAAARLDRAARANAALRHLSGELAERAAVLRARYILIDDDHVTVVLDQPAAPPSGWELVEDPVGWRCTLDDTALAYAADVNPHPWPAVVPLGVTVDGDATVLVDLEALGVTGLGGPAGGDVCAAMICALGASPSADLLTVVDDGHVDLYGLDPYLSNRITLAGIEALLERLETWSEPFRFDTRHLLTQRRDDPGELEPCVAAIVAHVDDRAGDRLRALPTDGTRPIAIITTDPAIARTVIDVDEHGIATFHGQTIRCHRLTPTVAATTRQLIDHAETAPVIEVRRTEATEPVEQPSLFPPDPDAWTVRVLGPLRITHRAHGELPGGRSRQLLTLLALHPDGLSGEDIYDAVNPDKLADPDGKRTYVKARMSELRKLLGGGDTIAGRTHLPLTSTAGTDRYRVEAVHVDTARFRRLIDHPRDELTDLTAALELIDGEVGGDELAWFPWATHTIHHLHALIVDTGHRLATAALAAGQPTLADWAATQTRLAVRYDQSVVPLAIRARSLLGDRIGVRRLREEIVDTHNGNLASDVKAAFDDALAAG